MILNFEIAKKLGKMNKINIQNNNKKNILELYAEKYIIENYKNINIDNSFYILKKEYKKINLNSENALLQILICCKICLLQNNLLQEYFANKNMSFSRDYLLFGVHPFLIIKDKKQLEIIKKRINQHINFGIKALKIQNDQMTYNYYLNNMIITSEIAMIYEYKKSGC